MRVVKLSKPHITQEAIKSVVAVLESGWLIQGPKVTIFEQNFKEYLSRNFKTFGGWNGKDLYQVSFYIQYSQFLKFIF